MQTEPSPSQKESKPLCVVCKEQESKWGPIVLLQCRYRCPKCGATYCSVACFKVHKVGDEGENQRLDAVHSAN